MTEWLAKGLVRKPGWQNGLDGKLRVKVDKFGDFIRPPHPKGISIEFKYRSVFGLSAAGVILEVLEEAKEFTQEVKKLRDIPIWLVSVYARSKEDLKEPFKVKAVEKQPDKQLVKMSFGEAKEDEKDNFEEELGHSSVAIRRASSGRTPTQKEVEIHEEQNHGIYRDWCEVCVASKAHGTLHLRKSEEQRKEDEASGPRVFSDFFFMTDDEKSAPLLALKDGAWDCLAIQGQHSLCSKGFWKFPEAVWSQQLHQPDRQ